MIKSFALLSISQGQLMAQEELFSIFSSTIEDILDKHEELIKSDQGLYSLIKELESLSFMIHDSANLNRRTMQMLEFNIEHESKDDRERIEALENRIKDLEKVICDKEEIINDLMSEVIMQTPSSDDSKLSK